MHRLNSVARAINETFAKKIEQITLLPKSRIVVPAVRLRRPEDTIELLKNSKLTACYLKLYNDELRDHKLVHFVLEEKQLFALRRLKDREIRPVYVVIDNKEYRCLVEKIVQHPSTLSLPSFRMDRECCLQRVRRRQA